MADCCEPGCSDEVLCPVHQALADLRAKVQAERDRHGPGRAHDRGVPYYCGHCEALELVLDLIDKEADRD